MISKCGFAPAGTMGHICGRPAVMVAVFSGERTEDGLFYVGRCEKHKELKHGDNVGMLRLEPLADQKNSWKKDLP